MLTPPSLGEEAEGPVGQFPLPLTGGDLPAPGKSAPPVGQSSHRQRDPELQNVQGYGKGSGSGAGQGLIASVCLVPRSPS